MGLRRSLLVVSPTRRADRKLVAAGFTVFLIVSRLDGQVVYVDICVAIDPRNIVNPAVIEAHVNSAIALDLSLALLEEVV
jgi:isoquinoline 1-oxidoreductase subunit beta